MFNIILYKKHVNQDLLSKGDQSGIFSGKNYEVQNRFSSKFERDKIFHEDAEKLIVLDGVVLNQDQLKKGNTGSWHEIIWNHYENKGGQFVHVLRGSFTGCIHDKKTNSWLVFVDHIGSKHLYYYESDQFIMFSTSITDIYDLLKRNNIKYDLDVESAYMLLSYGYMLKNKTLCKQVFKLNAGNYITVSPENKLKSTEYYQIPLSPESGDINEEETIEALDHHFRKAVERQFEKDLSYGYKHLVGLSGGLDSRMTSWVAHEMGYTNQLNITFSQSNYLDETIPKQIASDLGHEWLFKFLDNGVFLKDLDDITAVTGGNVLYYGLAHGNSLMKYLNFDNLGILHTGQLGDVVIGSFVKKFDPALLNKLGGAYSQLLKMSFESSFEKIDSFSNYENLLHYQRGINGANNGLLAAQQYTETMSPFYDIDFWEYCLTIPIVHRMGHKLYKQWILKKHPKAADYVWESIGTTIKKNKTISYKGKEIPVSKLAYLIKYKLGLTSSALNSKNHMNPMDYWYNNNENLRQFMNQYASENINLIQDPELKSACENLIQKGGSIEKNQALSLLSAIKMYF